MQVQTATLARTFALVLREWLTADEMGELVSLNRAETDSGICHSHDFCDANMAMEEAFERHGVEVFTDVDGEMEMSDETTELWNEAWDRAKAASFDPAAL